MSRLGRFTAPSADAPATGCLSCGDDTDRVLAGVPEQTIGVCRDCWNERNHNGVAESLLGEEVLTPRLMTEVQEAFYEDTTPRQSPMTDHLSIFAASGVPVTTVRLGTARDLALLAGVGAVSAEKTFFTDVAFPEVEDADETLYAAALFPPVSESPPAHMGVFAAARTIEALDETLEDGAAQWGDD